MMKFFPRKLAAALGLFLALGSAALSQSPYPQTLPANTVVGRIGNGNAGPAQAIPFANLSGQLFNSLSGDCTVSVTFEITCAKINGTSVPASPSANQILQATSSTSATWTTPRILLTAATTFYVSTTGSDVTGNGSSGSPWATLGNACYQVTANYDWGTQTPKIQIENGTYNFASTGDSGCFPGNNVVGGNVDAMLEIVGNDATPSDVILNLASTSAEAFNIPEGQNGFFYIHGIEVENGNGVPELNCQSTSGIVFLGNSIWANDSSAQMWDFESGCQLISGNLLSGSNPTITLSGSNSQLLFLGNGSRADFNAAVLAFGTSSWSFAIFNVQSGGDLNYHNTATGSPTGTAFVETVGGIINATTSNESANILPSAMPGNSAGINTGGCFNNNCVPFMPFASLPSSPTITLGWEVYITDGKAANCADSACTTWGTNITGGGGSLPLLAWWNGSHFTLVGK